MHGIFLLTMCVCVCLCVTGCFKLIPSHVASAESILIRFEGRGHVGGYWFDRCPWQRPVSFWLRPTERKTLENALMDGQVDTGSAVDGRGERDKLSGAHLPRCAITGVLLCKHWGCTNN